MFHNLFLFKIISVLFNSQLNKLKSGMKNGTEVTFKLSSTAAGDSNDENNILQKLLLTNT